jgi:protein involved in polysaccharide export with SLBB domain
VSNLPVEIGPIYAGNERGLELRNGDHLVVRHRQDERVTITIEGEFRAPGTLVLPAGTTLGKAMALAEGVTNRAFLPGARFYRVSEQQAQTEHLQDLARRLRSTIAVNQQRAMRTDTERDKADQEREIAIQQAGLQVMTTATATGRLAGIRLAEILAGDAKVDVALMNGDRLVVPPRPSSMRVLGEVKVPGSMVWQPGVRPAAAVAMAGGFTREADESNFFVVRADGTVATNGSSAATLWDPNRRAYVRANVTTLDLQEGDALVVPPDLRYRKSNLALAMEWSQLLFQVAVTAGTVAVLAK